MSGCPGVESLPTVAGARHRCGVARYDVQTTWPGPGRADSTTAVLCRTPHLDITTAHGGGVITSQVSSLDIRIAVTNDMSHRGSTIHLPPATQAECGECCRLQDDLYCFLGKLQESTIVTIARAVTRHGVQVVRGTQ